MQWHSERFFVSHATRVCVRCSLGKDTLKFRSEEDIQKNIPVTDVAMSLLPFMRWGYALEDRPHMRPAVVVFNFGFHTVTNTVPWPYDEIASLGETERLRDTQLIWKRTTQVGLRPAYNRLQRQS